MSSAAVIEITPELLRERAKRNRERADQLREEVTALGAEAYRLEREADALEEAQRLRAMTYAPNARAALAGEVAAYLARCREPKSSTQIAERFKVAPDRARSALELLVDMEVVLRTGLKRGTRYRLRRDDDEPESHPSGRFHERVRDAAVKLGTFTAAEIEAETGVSKAAVYRWLVRLVADGVLTRERVGNVTVYAHEAPAANVAPMSQARDNRATRRNGSTPVAGTGKTKYSRRDVAEVVRVAQAAGAEIKLQKHGYAVVVDGQTVTSVPKTPSDKRSLDNARATLKRNGIGA